MLSLNATFENSLGRRHSIKIKDPNRNKPAGEIRACLQKLVELNLFEKDEVGLFKKLISAKFVETIETPIFDLRELEGAKPSAQAADVQPEAVQDIEIQEAPAIKVQSKTIPVQEAPAVQLQEIRSAEIQLAPIEEMKSQDTPIQTSKSTGASEELQQMEIIIPEGVDVSSLTEEDYRAIILSQLPEGAILDSFSVEEVPSDNQKLSEKPVALPHTSTIVNQLLSQAMEGSDEVVEEKRSSWFPKRKSGTNPLAGFSTDKRRNKKAINRWKREKNKDKK